jgi:Ca2+-binding EF-hand superfamily protein
MRHACKNRWFQIIGDIVDFSEYDLNDDGVLDRFEIKKMMEQFLGHEPAEFVVDDMIAALDEDENGVIDKGEVSFLLARMEREQNWKRF